MNNVLFTKVSVFRNLKDYKFSHKLTPEKQDEIVKIVESNINSNFKKVDLNLIDAQVKDYFDKYRLINGRYNLMFSDLNENSSISLFDEEHLVISASEYGFSKKSFEKVMEMVKELSNKISMSYSDRYGYLMSSLMRIGTGLIIQTVINLQAIKMLGKIKQVEQNVKNLGYNLKCLDGDNYILYTGCTLGLTETEVFDNFQKTISKLQDLETESLNFIASTNQDELEDKVNRSYGIARYASLMTVDECKNIISNLILGKNLKVIDLSNSQIEEIEKLCLFAQNSSTKNKDLALKLKEILKGGKND